MLYDICTTKSPNGAFLRTYSCPWAIHNCIFFHPVRLFTFLVVVYAVQKVLILVKSNFLFFSFVTCAFGFVSKKTWSNSRSQKLLFFSWEVYSCNSYIWVWSSSMSDRSGENRCPSLHSWSLGQVLQSFTMAQRVLNTLLLVQSLLPTPEPCTCRLLQFPKEWRGGFERAFLSPSHLLHVCDFTGCSFFSASSLGC